MRKEHQSVLLEEAVDALSMKPNGFYIDATFGRGGHSQAILQQLNQDGRLLAIDKDPEAINNALNSFKEDARFACRHGSFRAMKKFAEEFQPQRSVDGVLFDLGVSSPQLDQAARGFSFMHDGPLDMRMNTQEGLSAAEWLASVSEQELVDVLFVYGEERFARRIARAIVTEREETPLTSTKQLATLIAKAVPKKELHKHPATRSFQAIRIWLNQELSDLQQGLETALDILTPGGRIVAISFHSLEDRCVKQFMKRQAEGDPLLRKLPLSEAQRGVRLKIIGKAQKPSQEEIARNVRARSAILRIGEKIR